MKIGTCDRLQAVVWIFRHGITEKLPPLLSSGAASSAPAARRTFPMPRLDQSSPHAWQTGSATT